MQRQTAHNPMYRTKHSHKPFVSDAPFFPRPPRTPTMQHVCALMRNLITHHGRTKSSWHSRELTLTSPPNCFSPCVPGTACQENISYLSRAKHLPTPGYKSQSLTPLLNSKPNTGLPEGKIHQPWQWSRQLNMDSDHRSFLLIKQIFFQSCLGFHCCNWPKLLAHAGSEPSPERLCGSEVSRQSF